MTTSVDVAVLGAGPAGLMAARRLAEQGRSTVVLERADVVGGMAGSFDLAGVRVDYGSHRLHPVADPALLADLRALLGDDLQQHPRRGRVALNGRWFGFPLRLGDLARNLPKPFLARVAVDTLTAPLRSPKAATAEAVVEARLGPTVARNFYSPYIRKLWGMDLSELTPELADRRISARSGLGIIKKALRTRKGTGGAGTYLYPRRGFGQISEAVADAAVRAGADLRLGAAVSGVSLGAGSVRVATDDGEVEARTLLSTIPVPVLAQLAGATAEVLAAANTLRYRAMVLAYLVLDADQLTPFDAHYFPELSTPVSRMNEPKNYRVSADDPTGVTVVCAELPCWEGDATWTASADELAGEVTRTLAPLGFEWPKVLEAHVRRIPRCYPVYTGEYEPALATLEGWVASHPRLLTLGRQGLFAPDNTHHVLGMGEEAAKVVRADGSIDAPRWAAAREAFRTNVVED